MRKACIFALCLVTALAFLCSCGARSNMPFNGDVEFHQIQMTIPESYVRDSTQSDDNMWIFEQGRYSKYIILSCKETADPAASIAAYTDFLESAGGTVVDSEVAGTHAVRAAYTQDSLICYETLFSIDDSVYSIALRGGDRNEYQSILDSVTINCFTTSPTYSYDHKYKAVSSINGEMIEISVYSEEGDLIGFFEPCRKTDFWGICWENDSYSIWVQSGDTGVICYRNEDDSWVRDEDAERPDHIISKYDS
ncbi:MAG: hypothetical protein J6Z43_08900 [Clostridiales bacterium]|nr:hypothetical protein [Clostridiales bacterium]